MKEMKKEHPEALLPKQLLLGPVVCVCSVRGWTVFAKMLRKEQTRGGVPKASEQPVMNLVTSKNFIDTCMHTAW